MSSEKKNTVSNSQDRESWSKSEELWQRVNSILTSGVLARVNEKQMETRRYLEDVEDRFIDIIKKAKIELEPESLDLPDTAAYLPSGNISLEIQNAIGAINLLNDKHLKFRLTSFVDDYRRILEMNREEERHELLHSLEEYFEKGSYDFVEQKEETQEMLDSAAVVEEEARKLLELKQEVVVRSKQLKQERDQALTFHLQDVKAGGSTTSTEKPKSSKDEVLSNIFDILQKPHIMKAIGMDDIIILRQNIDSLANPRIHDKKKEPKKGAAKAYSISSDS